MRKSSQTCLTIAVLKQTCKDMSELKECRTEQKSKFKRKSGYVTESNLLFEEGNKDEKIGRLRIKPGKT